MYSIICFVLQNNPDETDLDLALSMCTEYKFVIFWKESLDGAFTCCT